jgi:hypothetical protein
VPGMSPVLAHVHAPDRQPLYLFTVESAKAQYEPATVFRFMQRQPDRFQGMQVLWLGMAAGPRHGITGRVAAEGGDLPPFGLPPAAVPPFTLMGLGVGGQRVFHPQHRCVVLEFPGLPADTLTIRRVPNRARALPIHPSNPAAAARAGAPVPPTAPPEVHAPAPAAPPQPAQQQPSPSVPQQPSPSAPQQPGPPAPAAVAAHQPATTPVRAPVVPVQLPEPAVPHRPPDHPLAQPAAPPVSSAPPQPPPQLGSSLFPVGQWFALPGGAVGLVVAHVWHPLQRRYWRQRVVLPGAEPPWQDMQASELGHALPLPHPAGVSRSAALAVGSAVLAAGPALFSGHSVPDLLRMGVLFPPAAALPAPTPAGDRPRRTASQPAASQRSPTTPAVRSAPPQSAPRPAQKRRKQGGTLPTRRPSPASSTYGGSNRSYDSAADDRAAAALYEHAEYRGGERLHTASPSGSGRQRS